MVTVTNYGGPTTQKVTVTNYGIEPRLVGVRFVDW